MTLLPVGPYKTITLAGGGTMPWYMMPFDRDGICTGPQTRAHLMQDATKTPYTDIYLFSHGWNNDWKFATGRYQSFIQGYAQMRAELGLDLPAGYHPLLVGIFWPSIVLLTEREQAPQILADGPNEDALVEEDARLSELADAIDPAHRARFYELMQRAELDVSEAEELAGLMQPLYASKDDELPDPAAPAPADIAQGWLSAADAPPVRTTKKTFGTATGNASGAARAAGSWVDALKRLLPRDVIRLATVRRMKDRAGRVGAMGVCRLLEELLEANEAARLHLIGHSYGAKVVLSALANARLKPSRKAYSMLLLQPAVSHLCFAEKVPGPGTPGGYRGVLDRVERPVFATYSANDFPLRRVFHAALRRGADTGEARIAAESGAPPSIYAALGGYGPRASGEALIDLTTPKTGLRLDAKARLYGVDGSNQIGDHGDISKAATWWLSHCASWQAS